MTDHHVHIEQFNEIYYDALELFALIEKLSTKAGVTEIRPSAVASFLHFVSER